LLKKNAQEAHWNPSPRRRAILFARRRTGVLFPRAIPFLPRAILFLPHAIPFLPQAITPPRALFLLSLASFLISRRRCLRQSGVPHRLGLAAPQHLPAPCALPLFIISSSDDECPFPPPSSSLLPHPSLCNSFASLLAC